MPLYCAGGGTAKRDMAAALQTPSPVFARPAAVNHLPNSADTSAEAAPPRGGGSDGDGARHQPGSRRPLDNGRGARRPRRPPPAAVRRRVARPHGRTRRPHGGSTVTVRRIRGCLAHLGWCSRRDTVGYPGFAASPCSKTEN